MESTAAVPEVFANTTVVYSDLRESDPFVITGAALSSLHDINKIPETKIKTLSTYLNMVNLLIDLLLPSCLFLSLDTIYYLLMLWL
jgi:hypothetical protein